MALLGHVTSQMTRYTALADGMRARGLRGGTRQLRGSRELPIVVAGRPVAPDRMSWLRSEMLKTRLAQGYCFRHLAAEACPYANICEQCDNYMTTAKFRPQLQAQLTFSPPTRTWKARGWDSEVARHDRLVIALQRHLDQLERSALSVGSGNGSGQLNARVD